MMEIVEVAMTHLTLQAALLVALLAVILAALTLMRKVTHHR
jgi:hypothetical protein